MNADWDDTDWDFDTRLPGVCGLSLHCFVTAFCDQNHLSRHFKRRCGVTPGHFVGARRVSPTCFQEASSCA